MPFTEVKFKTISLDIYIETNRYSTNVLNSLLAHIIIVGTYKYYSTYNRHYYFHHKIYIIYVKSIINEILLYFKIKSVGIK